MKTKIYATETIKTEAKTFKRGEIIAEVDAPITPEQLVTLLTSGQASPSKPADPEPTDARPKPVDEPAKSVPVDKVAK